MPLKSDTTLGTRAATSAHYGPVPVYTRPSCTPEQSWDVRAPPPYLRVAAGLLRLFFLCRVRAGALKNTRRQCVGRPPITGGPVTVYESSAWISPEERGVLGQ